MRPDPDFTLLEIRTSTEWYGTSLGDLRCTVEARLAAAAVSMEIRARLRNHGLGGVQAKHYDRHDYLNEKRAALETLHRPLTGNTASVTAIKCKAS